MMRLAQVTSAGLDSLTAAAAAAGLTVLSSAAWPETEADQRVPALAGFIESNFSPLLAEVAARALGRRIQVRASGAVTGVLIVTSLGDVTSATRVAAAVDAGQRVPPLLFFQSVPNAAAGYLAARAGLTGPVVCLSEASAGLEAAALLIEDADADEVLVVTVDVAVTSGDVDRAAAILVTAPAEAAGSGDPADPAEAKRPGDRIPVTTPPREGRK
jgi:3-oxoacyl-(acyl-carrier-protein) synthase